MKIITYSIAITMWVLAFTFANAQETTDNKDNIEVLQQAKEQVQLYERDALKEEVEAINKRLENQEITSTEAENFKNEAAQKRALNIENKLAIIDNKIALLERNKGNATSDDDNRVSIVLFDKGSFLGVKSSKRNRKYDRRTYSDLVIAFGLNNVISDGHSLDDSDYKVGGSRFFELGIAWKTRVFKNTNWLRLKYGFSFQFNSLKPTDNRYFVDTGSETELQTFPENLNKSKLRIDNLVFPVHFEFGPSNKIEKENYFRYSTYKKIKVGLGGYAGFNLGVRQKLKYDGPNGTIREKTKANFNTNNFVYGLSGYIGWRGTALYVKYDLNTIFKDNPIEQRNISLGLRFDMD